MQTASNRSESTRFKAGNQAARRHGLRAGTRKELRRRDSRTSRLVGAFLVFRADAGRPVGPTLLPLVRRFCEAEVRGRDLYAALQADPLNARLHEMWASTGRLLAQLARELGESGRRAEAMYDNPYHDPQWREAQILELTGGSR